jgi:hypothetical protein
MADTDPDSLYSGSGSFMFQNEKLAQQEDEVTTKDAILKRQQSELIPVANDLLEFLALRKSQNADIRSYLQRVRGDKSFSQLTGEQLKELAVQAEAREMNIVLIEDIERWIRDRLRRRPK